MTTYPKEITMTKNAFTITLRRERVVRTRKVRRADHAYNYTGTERAVTRYWDEEARCVISIDLDALCRVAGARAMHAKSGKSTALNGIITCKVINRVESNVEEREHPLTPGYEIVHVATTKEA